MKFTCNFCSKEQDLEQLAGVQIRKKELKNLEELKEKLEGRLSILYLESLKLGSKPEQKKQKDELEERIKTIHQNIQILKKRFCRSCLNSWKNNANEEKEKILPNFKTFTCDLCHETKTGTLHQKRIDAPCAVPAIPKDKLCNLCDFCDVNSMQTNMAEIIPPIIEKVF